jgi:transcriptional regulator EpsA
VNQLVILSKMEQEYLLRIIEASVQLRDLPQFFLWSQGQLQALLPHQLLVCMHFDADGALLRLQALGGMRDEAATARLCDAPSGLALRLARHCVAAAALPCMAELRDGAIAHIFAPFQHELAACGYDNLLLDGSGPLAGGTTVFALFGLPMRPGPRHAYFLALLLPHLHLALLRLAPAGAAGPRSFPGTVASAMARPLSAREAEIVHWLRAGKRNDEIGAILGLSALTVKNHLQRIYKLLGVRNRGEAVARCAALHLLGDERRLAATAY